MGQTILIYKLGGGTVGFIGEDLGRAKGLKEKKFPFLMHWFFIIGFQWV
jgi:hypothetical protein